MNTAASPVWTSGTTEVNHTGTWRSRVPAYINPPSPCHSACPVNGNIALWIQQIKENDYRGAWFTLVENNPFPAVTGRVCHHPCEPACNRGAYDEAVSICALERFVGDLALAEQWSFPATALTKKEKVAIVGGGPAGLAAAYHLRRRGYWISLFEARAELGGLLRFGIPAYRLSRDVLEQEIRRILELGIEVHTSTPLDGPEALDRLQQEYDAVYLATGASIPKRLPILDYHKDWVLDGQDYLARTNKGEIAVTGRRVVVIGGGSAAMDVARTARRLDLDITILSLEPEDGLPCQKEEVVESREEGIRLINGAMLRSVTDKGEEGLNLECIGIEFTRGDARDEFTIEPQEGTEFRVEADTIITAIGQDPDLSVLGDALASRGPLIRIGPGQHTSREGVFAGGDAASMERFVTHAFGMGREVAAEIDRCFHPERPTANRIRINRYRQEDRTAQSREKSTDVNLAAINTYYHDHLARENQATVSAQQRLQSFDETRLNLDLESALREVGRCFSCGNCIFCDNCLYYCPDMAITRVEQGYRVNTDFCKGCGLCVNECPTGSIAMFPDSK